MSHVLHVLIYTAWCLLLPVVLGAALWLWGEDGPRNDEPPGQHEDREPGGLLAAA